MTAAPAAKGLTREQHRLVRRHLALIPAYVWLFHIWPLFFTQLPLSHNADARVVRDFLHFYTQGAIAHQHNARALYDMREMADVADSLVPGGAQYIVPPVYAPQVSLLFEPLSRVAYTPALYLWLAFTMSGFAACIYVLWRTSQVPDGFGWPLVVLSLGAPGLHFTLSFGQASVLGLFSLTALWLALRARLPLAAGLAVSALAYKPQLGLVAASVFLFRKERLVVFGAVVGVTLQVLAAGAYWGGSVFIDYFHALARVPALLEYMEPDPDLSFSLRAVASQLHLAPIPTVVAIAGVSALALGASVIAWRETAPLELRYTSLVLATLLVNPHLYAYDLLLATPAMVVGGSWAIRRKDRVLLASLALLYVAPILTAILPVPPVLTPLILSEITAYTIWLAVAKRQA